MAILVNVLKINFYVIKVKIFNPVELDKNWSEAMAGSHLSTAQGTLIKCSPQELVKHSNGIDLILIKY